MKEGARREEACANGCWGRFAFFIAVGLFVCCLGKIQGQGEKN